MVDELHLLGDRAEPRRRRRAPGARRARSGSSASLYPLLIAPAYALFDSLPDAYAAAQDDQRGRDVAGRDPRLPDRAPAAADRACRCSPRCSRSRSRRWSTPARVMTENAFYPVFLLAALALVRALERPTLRRQLVLLAACGVVTLVRVQAIAVVLAALTAPLLLWLVARQAAAAVRRRSTASSPAARCSCSAPSSRAGAPISSLLGAYEVVGERRATTSSTCCKFLVYHLAELDLYVGVIPFAAFARARGPIALARAPRCRPSSRPRSRSSVWTLLVVATFASRFAGPDPGAEHVRRSRRCFLIALLAWVERGAPRPRVVAASRRASRAVLPALIPFDRFVAAAVRLGHADARCRSGRPGRGRAAAARRRRRSSAASSLRPLFLFVPRRVRCSRCPRSCSLYFARRDPADPGRGRTGSSRPRPGRSSRGSGPGQRDWIDQAAGDEHRRRALDREDESLHRAHERVLQPHGRPGLHPRRADAGRLARDRRPGRSRDRRDSPRRGRQRRRGAATSSPTARSPSTATLSPQTSRSG